MSDEQKKIEELEQQLKIAKMEKELAKLKANNSKQNEKQSQGNDMPKISKKMQKELDKGLQEKEEQEAANNVFNLFVGSEGKTRETVLRKLENSKKRILVSEYFLLSMKQQDTYKSRVNWFSWLLYPFGLVFYLIALFFQHPWENSLILALLIFLFGNPFSNNYTFNKETGESCQKLKVAGGNDRWFCSTDVENLRNFGGCSQTKQYQKEVQAGINSGFINDSIIYNMCATAGIYEKANEIKEESHIENETSKKINVHGINVNLANSYLEKETKKIAEECYAFGNTNEESLNSCIENYSDGE